MKSSSNSKIVKVITISAIIFIAILCVVIGITKKNGSTECAKGNTVTTAVTTVSDDGSLVTSSSSTTMKETTTSYVTTSITTNSAVTTSTTAVSSTVADSKEEVPTTNIPTVRDEATPTPVPKPEPLPEPCDRKVEEATPAPIVEEYLVYKPSTHYIHKNTCHWNCGDAYRIDNANGLEARLCTECGVQCEGYIEYIEPVPEPVNISGNVSMSDYEYNLLCGLIANEYGSASLVERAKIVAATFNACNRNGWSIETFIYTACVPYGYTPGYTYYSGVAASSMGDAIDYYFTYGESGFWDSGYWESGADSWWGDGWYNHFYRA